MAAITAGRLGRSVVVLEKNPEAGKKILISGGGRCNFTNRLATPAQYVTQSRHFHRTALRAFPPEATLAFFEELGITAVEKKPEKGLGQMFPMDDSARNLRNRLVEAAGQAGVVFRFDTRVLQVQAVAGGWEVATDHGPVCGAALAICTGGLAYPQLGAEDVALRLAKHLGLTVTETVPALVPLTLGPTWTRILSDLSGLALPVAMKVGKQAFRDDLLFAHFGLSGPVALQISSYWKPGDAVEIDFLPDTLETDFVEEIFSERTRNPKRTVAGFLKERFPERLRLLLEHHTPALKGVFPIPLASLAKADARTLAGALKRMQVTPVGTMGYVKAEVMAGGIATEALDPATMECRAHPGLYFAGECVDVTGWLGGYNFQWAWASGAAIGRAVAARKPG